MATAPFDSTAQDNGLADVIIRSSDGIDFYVSRVILSMSSTVFRDMLRHAQPGPAALSEQAALPVIHVTEDHQTLDILLRILYPNTEVTPPHDVDKFHSILEAGRKYDLEKVTGVSGEALMRLAGTEPFVVYTLACEYGLENVARTVAGVVALLPIQEALCNEHPAKLRGITAIEFQRLLIYRQSPCVKQYTKDASGSGCHVQPWFSNHMLTLKNKLFLYPWNEAEAKAEFIHALKLTCPCDQCRQLTSEDMGDIEEFIRKLSENIAAEQAQIVLDFVQRQP
ncbi:hypothetical protein EUX98_g2929 [Antrodiella citrinella]|uniref:BTB domain-containing protein n=1 Tax=Antrodiella citrinella TaxID=2447956 RepID=A0A4S4MXT4_9APHY|nr:hypothetical protein EUX98_g2929 [Antrodiella citrinella]